MQDLSHLASLTNRYGMNHSAQLNHCNKYLKYEGSKPNHIQAHNIYNTKKKLDLNGYNLKHLGHSDLNFGKPILGLNI